MEYVGPYMHMASHIPHIYFIFFGTWRGTVLELRASAAATETAIEESKAARSTAEKESELVSKQQDEEVNRLQASVLAVAQERELLQQGVSCAILFPVVAALVW